MTDAIRLAHGGGGRLSRELVDRVFLPVFGNADLAPLNDSAILNVDSKRLAFTTDTYVVDPLFFPGGDIGKLAVCGTVNDLAVMGAEPAYLSLGFILEEGLPIALLREVVDSIGRTAREAGVRIVTGDTKVVAKGQADKLFINSAGIGFVHGDPPAAVGRAQLGDQVLVSGAIGCHGMAVVTARRELGITTPIQSDVAPLAVLVRAMMAASNRIHVMRDATRGGLAAVTNEMAIQAGVGFRLNEAEIPVNDDVTAACELLGFDPLYVANEGVLVACVAAEDAGRVLDAMRAVETGRGARRIGEVVADGPGRVVLKTHIGTHRIVDLLSGEQLPRIC